MNQFEKPDLYVTVTRLYFDTFYSFFVLNIAVFVVLGKECKTFSKTASAVHTVVNYPPRGW